MAVTGKPGDQAFEAATNSMGATSRVGGGQAHPGTTFAPARPSPHELARRLDREDRNPHPHERESRPGSFEGRGQSGLRLVAEMSQQVAEKTPACSSRDARCVGPVGRRLLPVFVYIEEAFAVDEARSVGGERLNMTAMVSWLRQQHLRARRRRRDERGALARSARAHEPCARRRPPCDEPTVEPRRSVEPCQPQPSTIRRRRCPPAKEVIISGIDNAIAPGGCQSTAGVAVVKAHERASQSASQSSSQRSGRPHDEDERRRAVVTGHGVFESKGHPRVLEASVLRWRDLILTLLRLQI